MGNIAFAGHFKKLSSTILCPKCRFPSDFESQNNIFLAGFPRIDLYCPNCGINLRTQKHDVKCDQYFQCYQKEQLRKEKNLNNSCPWKFCWNIPFQTKETWQYSGKPVINLNDINF
ncbi:MAG: hypothetical protein R6U27_04910 [Desulfobacterales bacterium]